MRCERGQSSSMTFVCGGLMRIGSRTAQICNLLGMYEGLRATTTTRLYSIKKESKMWRQKPNRNPRLSIILTEDVPKLGVRGQIVKVKHGYGRNHLLPYKRAVYATPNNIARMDAFEVEKAAASSATTSDVLVEYLRDKTLCVQHDPNDESALFEQHISMAFQDNLQLHVPLDCIELEEPITDFESEHSVGVRVDEETVVMVPLRVERALTRRKQRRVEKMERFQKKMESSRKVQEL